MRTAKRRIKKKSTKLISANQLSSSKQGSMIVDFLMKHPTLATCTVVEGRQRDIVRRLWGDLAMALNNLDGAHHSPAQWRRIWLDMKHDVKSKLAQNSAKKKNKMDNLDVPEQRIANILLKKSGRSSTCMCKCDIKPVSTMVSSEDDSEESDKDNATIELGINGVVPNDFPTEKDDYAENPEVCLSPPEISNIDTQEESQMSVSKSLQDICQQNAEILQHVRQTYQLMAEDSKQQQAYQSSKLLIYRKKLELLHTQLEMEKLISFSNI